MIKYLGGEIYRLIHKRSIYLYFAALILGHVLIAYIRSGGFYEGSVVNDAISLFNFMPPLAGGFLFAAVYTDDLNSKNLISLVGFGLSKTKIVISKFILMAVLCAIAFALAPLLHCSVYALLGWPAGANEWAIIYAASLKFLLMTVAFAVLSGIAVYGLQRATFAIVLYILLAFGVVSGLLSAAVKPFAPGIANYLMPGISDRIMAGVIGGGPLFLPVIEYVVYVAAAAALSALAFNKKEMEF